MIKNVHINCFRGIKDLFLEQLGQVNLLLGCNNSGKSSVLDALFLISGAANPLLNIRINSLRNYDRIEPDDLLLNYYNLDSSVPIVIAADMKDGFSSRELSIHPLIVEKDVMNMADIAKTSSSNQETSGSYGFVFDYRLTTNDKEKLYKSSLVVTPESRKKKEAQVRQPSGYKEQIVAQYISPNYDLRESVKILDEILKNKEEHHIVEILQQIEPRIKDIMLGEKAVMVDLGLSQRVPINIMGDGIRKILAVIVTLFKSKGGIVLIDEIDNGIHYKSIPILWSAVLSMAKKNNVQVFASTHNADSLVGLERILSGSQQDMQEKTMTYTLRRLENGDLKAFRYDYEKFNYVINQEIEIR